MTNGLRLDSSLLVRRDGSDTDYLVFRRALAARLWSGPAARALGLYGPTARDVLKHSHQLLTEFRSRSDGRCEPRRDKPARGEFHVSSQLWAGPNSSFHGHGV